MYRKLKFVTQFACEFVMPEIQSPGLKSGKLWKTAPPPPPPACPFDLPAFMDKRRGRVLHLCHGLREVFQRLVLEIIKLITSEARN